MLTFNYNFIDKYTLITLKMYRIISIMHGMENDILL